MDPIPSSIWYNHILDWAWAVVIALFALLGRMYSGIANRVTLLETQMGQLSGHYATRDELSQHKNELTSMFLAHKNDMHGLVAGLTTRIDRMDEKMDGRFDRITDLIMDKKPRK